jgi:hypothetical protein
MSRFPTLLVFSKDTKAWKVVPFGRQMLAKFIRNRILPGIWCELSRKRTL